jgi:hypothetical protein
MPAQNFLRPKIRFSGKLAIVMVLLLLQFALRTHNTTLQGAFVDEGLHDQRATIVWSLNTNPGQYSQGKLLLYYWIGLFVGGPLTILHVSRTAIALVSLITGAAIYLIGRRLHSHRMGIVALTLYTILPLAVFHERMALADPLASVFSCLIAWRSLVFASSQPT